MPFDVITELEPVFFLFAPRRIHSQVQSRLIIEMNVHFGLCWILCVSVVLDPSVRLDRQINLTFFHLNVCVIT